ncbi:unnamed protein product, partial [Prorocentrum cordatum]
PPPARWRSSSPGARRSGPPAPPRWPRTPATCLGVDWPLPKRRRADAGGLWHQGTGSDSSVLWGLLDALSLYASGSGCSSSAPATRRRRCGLSSPVGPPSPSSCSDAEQPK